MLYHYLCTGLLLVLLGVSITGIALTKVFIYDKVQEKSNCTIVDCKLKNSTCYDEYCECNKKCVKSNLIVSLNYSGEIYEKKLTGSSAHCNQTLVKCYFYPGNLPDSIKLSRNGNVSTAALVFFFCSASAILFIFLLIFISVSIYEKFKESKH